MIVNTNPTVRVANPVQSIPPVKVGSRDSSTAATEIKNVTMPIGTLRKKNHRHDANSVRMPARKGPSAEPARPTPDQMPSALARSSGSKALFTIETDTVKMIPPPTPCTSGPR